MTGASNNLSSKITKTVKLGTVNELELPETYNDTRVVVLPKDPVWIYVYWEISKEVVKNLLKQHNGKIDFSSIVLRVYDITDIDFNGKNAHKYFDIKTTPNTLSWYINVGKYNRSCCVDIGYILENDDQGDYLTVARSNSIAMPRSGLSNITDKNWSLSKFEFENFFKMFNLDKSDISSYNMVKFMKQYYEKSIKLKSSKNCR
jgi:hypothetical protein